MIERGQMLYAVLPGEYPYSMSTNLAALTLDRKSTRLNSSHTVISYAVFCLKKKKKKTKKRRTKKKKKYRNIHRQEKQPRNDRSKGKNHSIKSPSAHTTRSSGTSTAVVVQHE